MVESAWAQDVSNAELLKIIRQQNEVIQALQERVERLEREAIRTGGQKPPEVDRPTSVHAEEAEGAEAPAVQRAGTDETPSAHRVVAERAEPASPTETPRKPGVANLETSPATAEGTGPEKVPTTAVASSEEPAKTKVATSDASTDVSTTSAPEAVAIQVAHADSSPGASRAEEEALPGIEVIEVSPKVVEGKEKPSGYVRPLDIPRQTDQMAGVSGLDLLIERIDTVVTVTGFIKLDMIHDFREIDSPSQFITSDIVVPGGSRSQTTFSANPSRLVVGTATETRVGRLTTMFSMDFFGEPAGRGPQPRLRQAWAQLDGLLFGGGFRMGQSWSSWDDVPALPETLDFQGPNGSDQTRHPLLRWRRPIGQRWLLWVAAEDPDSNVADATSETRAPDGVLAAIYTGSFGHLKPAVLLRDVGGSDEMGTRRAFGWGISGSGVLDLPWIAKRDNLRFQIQYGEGIGSYLNEDDVPDAIMSGTRFSLLPVWAGYGAFQHWWHPRLRSNAVFGWIDLFNRDLQADDALNRTLYVASNLIWSPVDQVQIGVEFLWGQRKNKDGSTGHDPRLQFSTKLAF